MPLLFAYALDNNKTLNTQSVYDIVCYKKNYVTFIFAMSLVSVDRFYSQK